jgi:hypothetical protein
MPKGTGTLEKSPLLRNPAARGRQGEGGSTLNLSPVKTDESTELEKPCRIKRLKGFDGDFERE